MNIFEAVVAFKENIGHTYSVIHSKLIHYKKKGKKSICVSAVPVASSVFCLRDKDIKFKNH